MAPRNSQNRVLSSSSSGDGYGFFFVEDQDDREVPIQQVLTCENLQAYSPARKIVRNVSSCLSVSTMSTMSPNSSQRNSPRLLEDRLEKNDSPEVQKNIVFVFENNRAPGKNTDPYYLPTSPLPTSPNGHTQSFLIFLVSFP